MSSWHDRWLEKSRCLCPTLDGWKVISSGCPLHGISKITREVSADEVQKLKEDLEELQSAFNLIWKAQQRAIQMWQQKTGRGMNWPDKASLIVWLMEENESLRKQNQKLMEKASPLPADYIFYGDWT